MKTIVVFGASGDTGQYFVRYLAAQNEDYRIVASGRRAENPFADLPEVTYVAVDVSDPEAFAPLPDKAYAVVDLAGYMPARMAGYQPDVYFKINTLGTLYILEYCRRCGADRILFAQSFGDIKDNAEEDVLLRADSPVNFNYNTDHTVYVLAKNAAVGTIRHFHEHYGLKALIFRLPTIHLYSQADTFFVDGVERKIGYRILIDKARAGETIEVWGDPQRPKDMVYVKDFAQMLYKGLAAEIEYGVYNVGTGVGTPLIEQIRAMVKVFSPTASPSPIVMAPEKPNAPQYIMDITEARRDLGYEPVYDMLAMLEDFKAEMEKAETN